MIIDRIHSLHLNTEGRLHGSRHIVLLNFGSTERQRVLRIEGVLAALSASRLSPSSLILAGRVTRWVDLHHDIVTRFYTSKASLPTTFINAMSITASQEHSIFTSSSGMPRTAFAVPEMEPSLSSTPASYSPPSIVTAIV